VITLAHNHPSGDLKPSIEDRNAYDRYKELGKMLGIRVEDFVIVAQEDIFSLRRDTLDL
jgi:DNA repair protein RadC